MKYTRTTLSMIGCAMIIIGIGMLTNLAWTLVSVGCAVLLGCIISILEE